MSHTGPNSILQTDFVSIDTINGALFHGEKSEKDPPHKWPVGGLKLPRPKFPPGTPPSIQNMKLSDMTTVN